MNAVSIEKCSYGHTLRLLGVTFLQVQCTCSLTFYLFDVVMLQVMTF